MKKLLILALPAALFVSLGGAARAETFDSSIQPQRFASGYFGDDGGQIEKKKRGRERPDPTPKPRKPGPRDEGDGD